MIHNIYIFTFSPVYVAGPTKETVVKFWQMVWEYQLNTIVMLTRCVEDNKVNTLATANCIYLHGFLSLSSYTIMLYNHPRVPFQTSLLIGQSYLVLALTQALTLIKCIIYLCHR